MMPETVQIDSSEAVSIPQTAVPSGQGLLNTWPSALMPRLGLCVLVKEEEAQRGDEGSLGLSGMGTLRAACELKGTQRRGPWCEW